MIKKKKKRFIESNGTKYSIKTKLMQALVTVEKMHQISFLL